MNYNQKYKKYKTKYIELLKQKGGARELINAIRSNENILKITELIEGGADLTEIVLGKTALLYAVERGNTEIFKLLLDRSTSENLEYSDPSGKTALIYSIERGRPEIFKLLLERGVDINKCTTDGKSALLYAAEYGRNELCKLLLDHGADISQQNLKHKNALIYAVEYGNKETCELLLAAHIELEHADINNRTALLYAAVRGNIEIFNFLLESHANIEQIDISGNNVLLLAIEYSNNALSKILIDKNVGVLYTGPTTPLINATKSGMVEICKLLLSNGVYINEKDQYGKSALDYAKENRNTELITLLSDRLDARIKKLIHG